MTRSYGKKYVKQVQDPYSIKRIDGSYHLLKDGQVVRKLNAQSEDGADREAALFLKQKAS